MVSGKVHTKRYFKSAAGEPNGAWGHTSTFWAVLVRRSYRCTIPVPEPKPDALDHTMLVSTRSGVAQPLSPPLTGLHRPRRIQGLSPPPPRLLVLGARGGG